MNYKNYTHHYNSNIIKNYFNYISFFGSVFSTTKQGSLEFLGRSTSLIKQYLNQYKGGGIELFQRGIDVNTIKKYNELAPSWTGSLNSLFYNSLADENGNIKRVSAATMELMENAKGAAISQKTLSLAIEKTGKASKLASVGMKALSVAGNMLLSFAVTWAISFLIDQIDGLIHAFDRQAEKLEETKSAYEDSKKAVSDVETELSNVKERLEELNKIDNPTFVQQEEIDNLKEVTKELESQLVAKQAIAEIDASKVEQDFVKTVDQYSEGNIFATSQKKKNETDFDTHRFYVDEANFYRQQLADELAKEPELRDGKKIEKLQENISLYTGLATDVIKRISDSYETLTNASKDVPVNTVTRDSFKVIDDLGLQIAEAQAYGGSGSILADSFDVLWNSPVYTQGTKKLQELAEKGELALEAMPVDTEISKFIDACELIGIKAKDIVAYVNDQFVDAGTEVGLPKSTTADSLYSSLFKNTEAYTKLTEAMDEQNEAGVLSYETYKSLIEANAEFAEILVLTAEGWMLNSEALWAYMEAQDEMSKGEALSEIQKLYEQLAENPDDAGIQKEIDRFAALIREVDSATGALAKFKKAQESENQDADFGVGGEAYEAIKEGNKTGKIGTDDFKEAVAFMLGEDWQTTYAGDLNKAYKEAERLGKKYFGQKDERTGMANFRDELVSKKFGSYDGTTFKLFDGVTIEQIAKDLGMSYDAVNAMFGLMEAYGGEFEFPFVLSSDDIENIEEYKEKLSEVEKEKALEAVNKHAEELEETLSNAKPDSELYKETQQELEKTTHAAEVLKEDLEGTKVDPNTMSLDDLYEKLQKLEATVTTLGELGVTVPTEVTGDVELIKELINKREFTKYGKLEPTDNVTPKVEELENGDWEMPIAVDEKVGESSEDVVAKVEQTVDAADPCLTMPVVEDEVKNAGAAVVEAETTIGLSKPEIVVSIIEDKIHTALSLIGAIIDEFEKAFPGGKKVITVSTENELTPAEQQLVELRKQQGKHELELDGSGYGQVGMGLPTLEELDQLGYGSSRIPVNVEAEDDAGTNLVEDIQGQVDQQEPVELPAVVNEDGYDLTYDTQYDALMGVSQLEWAAKEAGIAQEEISKLKSAYDEWSKAFDNAKYTSTYNEAEWTAASENLQAASTNFINAYNSLATQVGTIQTVEVDANTSKAISAINALSTHSVTVTVYGKLVSSAFAKGTKNAPYGASLVDEEGAELIEHTSQGTYELGTNDGPRLTHLNKGDVVHTASETKKILSRMAKVGGFFRDGLNKGKAVIGKAFATGVSGSMSFGLINSILSKKSSGKGGDSSRKWKDYIKKLFDWIEIRLERLQTQTDKWILAASEAIGYITKNAELDKALTSTSQQIEETTRAYQRYLEQADEVAAKSQLSADIVQRIQDGVIDISSYDDDTKEKISAYQEWYDKAMSCVEAITELREQERDLATQKLDSILDHYQQRIDRLDAVVSKNDALLGLKAATGIRIDEADYQSSIDATNKKIQELTDSREAMANEFADLVKRGYILEGSEAWANYTSELENLDETIIETKTDLQDLIDSANQITLTNLEYALTALEASATTIHDMMSLHEAQGVDASEGDYRSLVENGMAQIRNLEAQNAELLKQQATLDPLSEKYQEIQDTITSNNETILDMKVSQEQWNDAVIDLEISKLQQYKDELSKTNDEYQRQKDLQQAIEDLERARAQRTQKVYREGLGFVFEADQDAVLDAQTKLEDVIHNQLLGKMDDLIEALDKSKEDTNVYDINGVLLGKEYTLPDIGNYSDLLKVYGGANSTVTSAMEDAKKAAYEQILKGVNTKAVSNSFQIGDIIVQGVDNPNDLASAIFDQFPNALLQALHSKN